MSKYSQVCSRIEFLEETYNQKGEFFTLQRVIDRYNKRLAQELKAKRKNPQSLRFNLSLNLSTNRDRTKLLDIHNELTLQDLLKQLNPWMK